MDKGVKETEKASTWAYRGSWRTGPGILRFLDLTTTCTPALQQRDGSP